MKDLIGKKDDLGDKDENKGSAQDSEEEEKHNVELVQVLKTSE